MAFDQIRSARIIADKTVPLTLNMLPGRPTIHVVYLGETNVEFWNDSIAKANAKTNAIDERGVKLSPQKFREARVRNRITVAKYAVKHLEAVHSDGKPATDADIPEFIDALPDDVFDIVKTFVSDAENFRERNIEGDAAAIAEK